MIILGIDPGIERLGWAVIEDVGATPRAIAFGCFATPRTDTVAERLHQIVRHVEQTITAHQPTVLSIEKILFQKNVKTAIVVAQARGAVLAEAARHHLLVVEHTPNTIKQALTGYGSADKRQMQDMVKRVFHLAEAPQSDDAADALAIAYAGHGAALLIRMTNRL